MRVLSVTAQKPCSTGSGVYLTEVVRSLAKMGVSQAVVAGVTREDRVDMPEGVTVYPVYFSSEKLPYPVVGMSDENALYQYKISGYDRRDGRTI